MDLVERRVANDRDAVKIEEEVCNAMRWLADACVRWRTIVEMKAFEIGLLLACFICITV